MDLYDSVPLTLTGDLDNQGRLSRFEAVVRERLHVIAYHGGVWEDFGVVEPGTYSRNIPPPQRRVWNGEEFQVTWGRHP